MHTSLLQAIDMQSNTRPWMLRGSGLSLEATISMTKHFAQQFWGLAEGPGSKAKGGFGSLPEDNMLIKHRMSIPEPHVHADGRTSQVEVRTPNLKNFKESSEGEGLE